MRMFVALLFTIACGIAHATTITIEPDDYVAGTDLTNISPYVKLLRSGGPVIAMECCAPGVTAPNGSLTFGNNYGFFASPFDPYGGPLSGTMFVIELQQAIADDLLFFDHKRVWG